METLTVRPDSIVEGPHQLVTPLAVDGSTYQQPEVVASSSAVYFGSDLDAPGVGSLYLPALDIETTGEVEFLGASFLTFSETFATSFNIAYPTIPGGIQAGDFAIIDHYTGESADVGAASTPATWSSRGSFGGVVAYRPRITRFYKFMAGGETGNVAVTSASARVNMVMRLYRGVDPDSPFDIGSAESNGGNGIPNPSAVTTVTPGAVVEVSVGMNRFPNGIDDWDPSMATGLTQFATDITDPRGFVIAGKTIATPGTEDPAAWGTDPDNQTTITDALRPLLGTGVTVVVVASVVDGAATALPDAPTMGTNEEQILESVLTSSTFTLTYAGQTTSAIAYNATAATIDAALTALSNIGATDVACTGGPLHQNPVIVEFTSALAETNVPLMTTSTGSVTVSQLTPGHPAATFTAQGDVNIPRTVDAPQVAVWSHMPSVYVAGARVDVEFSDHDGNQTWAAVLLVCTGVPSDPIGTAGGEVAELAKTAASFGSITPTAGARILALVATAPEAGGLFPTSFPSPSTPTRYTRAGRAQADGMILDVSISPPAPAVAESPGAVSWNTSQDYATGLFALDPAGSAGSLELWEAVDTVSESEWVELALAAGALYEVFECDLSAIPPDAILTGAFVEISHSSDVRSMLRVAVCGIDADGTIHPAAESKVGGYAAEPAGSIVTATTGLAVEMLDGTQIDEYSRLGVLVFSTVRHPQLSTHRLYSVAMTVEYEPGGPIVSDVVGPSVPGEAGGWTYSSGAGLAQTHVQFRVVQGFGIDPEVPVFDWDYDDFDYTVGPADAALTDGWEFYDSDGNAGFGVRRPGAIEIVADGTAFDGKALMIEASNGSGADTGQVVSGGLKRVGKPMRYGTVEVRVRATGDPDEIFSPVVLMWPESNEWPRDGEQNIVENYDNRDTLSPVEFHLHRLKAGAVEPYTGADDEKIDGVYTGITGTSWHKYVWTWAPDRITCVVDDGALSVTVTEDEAWIPNLPMHLTFQLDAWTDGPLTGGNNPAMFVDYYVLRRRTDDYYPAHPLDPIDGDILYDSGKLPGSLRRTLSITDAPLGRDNMTVQVRAWARLSSGREVVSPWAIASFDITGNPPTPATQTADPSFVASSGGVAVPLETPAGVIRAWLVRSTDQGATWGAPEAFTVAPSSSVTVVDYAAPLAVPALRYQVSFDAGPMTETTAPVAVGSGDIATTIEDWYLIVPGRPALNTRVDVAGFDTTRPRTAVVIDGPEATAVVVSDDLGRRMPITFRTLTTAERDAVNAVLDSGEEIRLVSILGRSWWVKVAGDVREQMIRGARPAPGETTRHRDAHLISTDLVQTRRA